MAHRLVLSRRWLVAIYAIIPVALLVHAVDLLAWDRALLGVVPDNPQHYFLFQLMFGSPHIVASSVILATNAEYVSRYGTRVLGMTAAIIAFFGFGYYYLSYEVLFFVVATFTIIHVLRQQIGIGRGICRLSGWAYWLWGWTAVLFGILLYNAIYLKGSVAPWGSEIRVALWVLTAAFLAFSLWCDRRIESGLGRLYLWSNTLMVLAAFYFYLQSYSFFAIVGTRVVHDVTAFMFYIAHDVNRHGDEPKNLLYRGARKLGLGIVWVCPALAVGITYLLYQYGDPAFDLLATHVLDREIPRAISFGFIGYLGLIHYYTEAFTWKRNSPYRDHVALR